MKKIEVSVSTNYIQCKDTTVIEVEDDATEEDINESALDAIFELIEYSWQEVVEDNEL